MTTTDALPNLPGKIDEMPGVTVRTRYPGGAPRLCAVDQQIALPTPYGNLVPLFAFEDLGRRIERSIELHPNGRLKSISLQQSQIIQTPLGGVSAERLTFHDNGALRRVLPLDGKLSGFWHWHNEYALARQEAVSTPSGVYTGKILSLLFDPQSRLRSLGLWPKDRAFLDAPVGRTEIRSGIAWHPNGVVRSFEPADPLRLDTPIGAIHAYDTDLVGLTGDTNSVQFDPQGQLMSLANSTDVIEITIAGGRRCTFAPRIAESLCNPLKNQVYPLQVRFLGAKMVEFRFPHIPTARSTIFSLDDCTYEIRLREIPLPPALPTACAC